MPTIHKGEFMGTVIDLRKQSPGPTDGAQFYERIDEVLADLNAIVSGKGAENVSTVMVRCVAALQASLEVLEKMNGLIAELGGNEKFLREARLINSRARSELSELASVLCATRKSVEEMVRAVQYGEGCLA